MEYTNLGKTGLKVSRPAAAGAAKPKVLPKPAAQ